MPWALAIMKVIPPLAKNNQELALFSSVFLCPCDKIRYSKLNPLLAIDGYHHLGNDNITVRLNSKQQRVVQVKGSL